MKCKFWFHNQKKHQHVLMGFPDFYTDPGAVSLPIHNFTCNINGKSVKVERTKQITTYESDSITPCIKYWYSWVAEIDSLDTLLIENTYTGEWGRSNYGTSSFAYVIGTASTWHESIGSGRVIFDFSNLCSQFYLLDPCGKTNRNGMNIERYDDSLVYIFNNYIPEMQECLSADFYEYWFPKNDSIVPEYLVMTAKKIIDSLPYTKAQFRIMRNEIYAHYGYVFKDKDLQTYFNERKWYKPNKTFQADSIKSFARELTRIIQKREEKMN